MSFIEFQVQIREMHEIIRHAQLLLRIIRNIEKDYGLNNQILSKSLQDIISQLKKTIMK